MKNTKSILLVEDNPDDEVLTLRALRKNRIDNPVVVVRDGAEALDYLFGRGHHAVEKPRPRPALILLDLNLPRTTGHEVIVEIKRSSRLRTIPVIILTTSADPRDVESAYAAGANGYVQKPMDFGSFVERLADLHEFWIGKGTVPPVVQGPALEARSAGAPGFITRLRLS